ncbi:hypothetical protein U1Q18_003571, partial [Sarracenia purpurea var. burkii]
IVKIDGIRTSIRRSISTPSITDSTHTTSTTGPTPSIPTEPHDSLNLNSVVDLREQSVHEISSTSPSTLGGPPPTIFAKDLLPSNCHSVPNPPGSSSLCLPSTPTHVPSTSSSSV